MKYPYLILLILVTLFITSCDRFEHNFAPQDPNVVDFTEVFFNPLQTAFNQASSSGLDPVMAFYADDYNYYGITKAARRTWLENLVTAHPGLDFSISNTQVNVEDANNATINWRLVASISRSVIADSTFVGEMLEKSGNTWVLKGKNVCDPPLNKQMVIVEYFTFRTCPGCPQAEAKLHSLQNQYPNFFYLEHHTSMELALPGELTPSYYNVTNAPVAVFQGTEKIIGSSDNELNQYQSLADALVQVDTPITYQLQNVAQDGRNLTGSVLITPLVQLPEEDLVLNYVIAEQTSSYTYLPGNQPIHNAVRAKGSLSLTGVNLALPVNFELTSTVDIPDDATLVLFVQKKPSPWQNNATIYGGITHPLNSAKPGMTRR